MNVVKDTNLKRVLNEEYFKRDPANDISEADLSTLGGTIYAVEAGVASLEGIQFATNISGLVINKNFMTDISQIAGLSQLTKLVTSENQISSVSSLKDLTVLDELDLSHNQIQEVLGLNELARVVTLDLSDNQIADCSEIQDLIERTIENQVKAQSGSIHLNNQKIQYDTIYTAKGKDVKIDWSKFGIYNRKGIAPTIDHISGNNINYDTSTNIITVSNVLEDMIVTITFLDTDTELVAPFSGVVSINISLIPTVSYVSKRLT